MSAIAQIKINPGAGEILLRLTAERAQPISGVLSSRDAGHLEPTDAGDPSVVQWVLPPVDALYVVYGVILPPGNLWFAPSYSRALYQGSSLVRGGFDNPRRFSTQKHAEGEWIGPPEALRLIMQ
jgi:hypothetical protein